MKKILYITLLLNIIFVSAFALPDSLKNKALIDSNAYTNWSRVEVPQINSDGNYTSYQIWFNNWRVKKNVIVVSATKTKWEKKYIGGSNLKFTSDGKSAIIQVGDTLNVIRLGSDSSWLLTDVLNFELIHSGNTDVILYKSKNTIGNLSITELLTRNTQNYTNISEYKIGSNGMSIILIGPAQDLNPYLTQVRFVDLKSKQEFTIWNGKKPFGFVFDSNSDAFAFIGNNGAGNDIWYCNDKLREAHLIVTNPGNNLADTSLYIASLPGFNSDGSKLFFELKKRVSIPLPNISPVKVDVWNYKDTTLIPGQLDNIFSARLYERLAVVEVKSNKIIDLISSENERIIGGLARINEKTLMINEGKGSLMEAQWNEASLSSVFLLDVRDGTRILISSLLSSFPGNAIPRNYKISPDEKYIVYYDQKHRSYFSYEIDTKRISNISRGVKVDWTLSFDPMPVNQNSLYGLAAWIKNEKQALIYSEKDIYLIDLTGKKNPINISSNGKNQSLIFRLVNGNAWEKNGIAFGDRVILSCFDQISKNDGFYTLILNNKGKLPSLCSMNPFLSAGNVDYMGRDKFDPIRAEKSETFIVRRANSSASTNFYLTYDFKEFKAISQNFPESNYNWLTTDLITWKSFDGEKLQGVLYKPENFNPKIKYPVIFYYYEKMSDNLNKYLSPGYSTGELNIPWYVSNGYLVFTPDISYKLGKPGESAYNSIVSAALHLSKLPFVNSKKMGLQGASWGAYQTNYVITHSDLFAAAMSASGVADLVSDYGALRFPGASNHFYYEKWQGRMGSNIWDNPQAYIKNSPVFFVKKVQTPVLLMNNKNDLTVAFSQGVEFFTALRRFGKKVWMLQYDNAGHGTGKQEDSKDYTLRMSQFFDHFLKDLPAPFWMTRGIATKMKGIDLGLALDYSEQ